MHQGLLPTPHRRFALLGLDAERGAAFCSRIVLVIVVVPTTRQRLVAFTSIQVQTSIIRPENFLTLQVALGPGNAV